MKKQSPRFHHLLRIYIPAERRDETLAEVLRYCVRTGCREVLLFTTSYNRQPSFTSLLSIDNYVQAVMLPSAEALRASGIIVSVNVLQTIGHVCFPKSTEAEFPFQRAVKQNGKPSPAGACPLCPNLRAWAAAAYRLYASVKPRILFSDDEFRTLDGNGLSCFCDRHLAQYAEQTGHAISREEMVAALTGHTEDDLRLRRVFRSVNTAGYCELASALRDAVHAVSPETRVGVMSSSFPNCSLGCDNDRVIHAFAGQERPFFRPQIDMYGEWVTPRFLPFNLLQPSRHRAVLSPNIEYYPEIENYLYTAYSKSDRCTTTQMAAQLLLGFSRLAVNFVGEPALARFSDIEGLVARLSRARRYFDALAALVPDGRRPLGVQIVEHPETTVVQRIAPDRRDIPQAWCDAKKFAHQLPALGLPVTHGVDSRWQLITGEDVRAYASAALDRLLSRGAMLDVRAAGALIDMGYGDRIGVGVGRELEHEEMAHECFESPAFNPSTHGQITLPVGSLRMVEPHAENARAISRIYDYTGQAVTPGVILTENAARERFAILPWDGAAEVHYTACRAEQLREVFAWIGRRRLPLCTHPRQPYLMPILTQAADGRMVAGIINLSTDTYNGIQLLWGGKQPPRKMFVLTQQGKERPASFDCEKKPRDLCLTVACRMEPLDVRVFILESTPEH